MAQTLSDEKRESKDYGDSSQLTNYTCRAYVPITLHTGFIQRSNHERLHFKWVERKRVAFERQLARVRQDMSVGVTANYVFPFLERCFEYGFPR